MTKVLLSVTSLVVSRYWEFAGVRGGARPLCEWPLR